MSTKPPANAEEAIEAYERLRAKNEAKQVAQPPGPVPKTPGPAAKTETKQDEPIWIERSVKAPGSAPYCMHELKFATTIPADEKTPQRIRDLRKVWDAECEEFEKQHVRVLQDKQPGPIYMPGVQSPPPPQKPALPYGINQIEWRDNQYGPGEYARTDQPETVELRKTLENVGKPIQIEGQSYWLNGPRTYVYRRPVEAAKK